MTQEYKSTRKLMLKGVISEGRLGRRIKKSIKALRLALCARVDTWLG